MSDEDIVLIGVYPPRKNAQVAEVHEIVNSRRSTRRNQEGSLFVMDQYTGLIVKYETDQEPLAKLPLCKQRSQSVPPPSSKPKNHLSSVTQKRGVGRPRKSSLSPARTASTPAKKDRGRLGNKSAVQPPKKSEAVINELVKKGVRGRPRKAKIDPPASLPVNRRRGRSSGIKTEIADIPSFANQPVTKKGRGRPRKNSQQPNPSFSACHLVNHNSSTLHGPQSLSSLENDSQLPNEHNSRKRRLRSRSIKRQIFEQNVDSHMETGSSQLMEELESSSFERKVARKAHAKKRPRNEDDLSNGSVSGLRRNVKIKKEVDEGYNDFPEQIPQCCQKNTQAVVEYKFEPNCFQYFITQEVLPAERNLEMFKLDPVNSGIIDLTENQFETYIEDNTIIEVPKTPCPVIYPCAIERHEWEVSERARIQAENVEILEAALSQAMMFYQQFSPILPSVTIPNAPGTSTANFFANTLPNLYPGFRSPFPFTNPFNQF